MSWLQNSQKITRVYTDGSCCPNPGDGGWACVIIHPSGARQELFGSAKNVTNNQMEMMACIQALRALSVGTAVYLFTDSQYVKKGISLWVNGWKSRGWKTALGEPVKNADLWQQLSKENDRHVISWMWVRGHDGNAHNERCDELALAARKSVVLSSINDSSA
jgi:ribonuclease HI